VWGWNFYGIRLYVAFDFEVLKKESLSKTGTQFAPFRVTALGGALLSCICSITLSAASLHFFYNVALSVWSWLPMLKSAKSKLV
jgi:hypothetical protein